jgi:SsrA-binding protein
MQMAKKQQQKQEDGDGKKLIAGNKKAFHDFYILEQIEAGMVLKGSEVKSLRNGKISLEEAYARVQPSGEVLLHGVTIPIYENATYANHIPDRPRRLLLHRREIEKLVEKSQMERLTIVPLEIYWRRGFAKVLLGTAKGKKNYDKRQVLRERDDKKAIQRAMRGRDSDD